MDNKSKTSTLLFTSEDSKKYFKFEQNNLNGQMEKLYKLINNREGRGAEFLGWLELPKTMLHNVDPIIKASEYIKKNYDYMIVVGIGGSYLGSKAVISALLPNFTKSKTQIIFAGNSISPSYHSELIDFLQDKNFCVNVISKSGTTLEPALAFRLLKDLMYKKFGEKETNNRIYATTDGAKGVLYEEAVKNNYQRFVIPDDVGGRFSVLTAVGLLPVAVAGIDIIELLKGANEAMVALNDDKLATNAAMQYGSARYLLYGSKFSMELMTSFHPQLSFLFEWWKQLFGESEGKEHKGLFVASSTFSTDLHSLGQFIQEGSRVFYETLVQVEEPESNLVVPTMKNDSDKLNYLAGKSIDFINTQVQEGTKNAHQTGNVPILSIKIRKLDAYNIGYLLYFFELSCAYSAYLIGVNPFNQEGVEEYKKNAKKLLAEKS